MRVRCEENIINIDSLKSQIFDFFDIWGSSGRPGTSFWRLFGSLGPHFGGPGGCWECTAILLPWLAGRGEGGAKWERIGSDYGKTAVSGLPN